MEARQMLVNWTPAGETTIKTDIQVLAGMSDAKA
jgi:hypothetical protein